MNTNDIKFIGFRASPQLAQAAKEKAKSQHRSLAGYLRHVVEMDLAQEKQKDRKA